MSSRKTRAAAPVTAAPAEPARHPHEQTAADLIAGDVSGYHMHDLRIGFAVAMLAETLDGEEIRARPAGALAELLASSKEGVLAMLEQVRDKYADFKDGDDLEKAVRDFAEEIVAPEVADAEEAEEALASEVLGHLLAGNIDDARRVLEQHADPLKARVARDVSRLTVQAPDLF